MKKFIILFGLLAFTAAISLNAKSHTKVGGGLAFGTDIEKPAIQVEAIFDIDAPVMIVPDFKYYLTDEFVTFWELNANVHYNLTQDENTNFFILGGLNYATNVLALI